MNTALLRMLIYSNIFIILSALQLPLHCNKSARPAFVAQTIDSTISIGYGIALGDVNGDGKNDVLLADKKQFVWYRNGDWKKFVMTENLTQYDNVCIAAKDINGDGKVEVAVGAQWNPSETNSTELSGSVHYLVRPEDPTQLWTPLKLPHEPTVHRMKWVTSTSGKSYLVVLPLHGRGNKGGEGEGVKVLAYELPADPHLLWNTFTIDQHLHLTHNFDVVDQPENNDNGLYIASKEGILFTRLNINPNAGERLEKIEACNQPAGEVRFGNMAKGKSYLATIEPMHGHQLFVYLKDDSGKRIVLDEDLKEGHALATGDFLSTGSDQVVAGWRVPNKEGKVGIKMFSQKNSGGSEWQTNWIDENGMACEDLQVKDLNNDGKPDIVAAGRSTRNLKIYWNTSR